MPYNKGVDFPDGISCFVSIVIESISREVVLDPVAARAAIAEANALIRRCALGADVLRELDPESGALLAFEHVSDALGATMLIAKELNTTRSFPKVGVSTLDCTTSNEDYVVDRLAALRSLAAPGQVLVDSATREIARRAADCGVELLPVGLRTVDERDEREPLFCIAHPDLSVAGAGSSESSEFHNLPSSLTEFVGRVAEIDLVLDRFYVSRAATICGPGGIGKTRLAIQVGYELAPRQPDGVWFVDLSGITDDHLVASTVLRALPWRTTEERPALERLVELLRKRQLTLVLDNAEDLTKEVAKLVLRLSACPNVQFLITSRTPIGFQGESVFRLGPLMLPTETGQGAVRSEAIELFLNRYRLLEPEFEPEPKQAEAIAELTRLVDGLPLAIEIASGLAATTSVDVLVRSLRRHLPKLAQTGKLANERHRRLDDVLQWGCAQLSHRQLELFNRLSVFQGSFTTSDVAALCEIEGPDRSQLHLDLAQLVRLSLLRVSSEGYSMLGPTRAIATERFFETEDVAAWKDRHASWVASLVSKDPSAEAYDRIESHLPDLRAALRWVSSKPSDRRGFDLCYALYDFWYLRGHAAEGIAAVTTTLKSNRRLDNVSKIRLLNLRGVLHMESGAYGEAIRDYDQAADLAAKGGHTTMEMLLLGNLGLAFAANDRPIEALALAHRCLEAEEVEGESLARQYNNVAAVLTQLGRYDEADATLERAALIEGVGDAPYLWAEASLTRATLWLRQGRFDEAQEELERTALMFADLADRRGLVRVLGRLFQTVLGLGLDHHAAFYWGCYRKLREGVVTRFPASEELAMEAAAALLASRLGAAFEFEVDRGRALSVDGLRTYFSQRVAPASER